MLRFKDKTPVDILSNFVYLFKCSQCEGTYVGELLVISTLVLLIPRVFHIELRGLFLNRQIVGLRIMHKKKTMRKFSAKFAFYADVKNFIRKQPNVCLYMK